MNLTTALIQNVAAGSIFQFAGNNCLRLDVGTGQQAVDIATGQFVSNLVAGTIVVPAVGAILSL